MKRPDDAGAVYQLVERYRRGRRKAHAAAAVALFLLSIALCIPALAFYDVAVRMSINHPVVLLLAVAFSAAVVCMYSIIHRERFGGFDAAVRELDDRYRMGFALRSYFEFEASPSDTEQRFREGFAERMRGAEFSPLRYWNEARRIARAAAAAWGGVLLIGLLAFPFTARTAVRYWQAMPFVAVAPSALSVDAPAAVLRGEEARIAVTADAEEVIIALPKRARALQVSNVWEYRIRPAADISFTVSAYKGAAVMRSAPRIIRAVDLPAVRTLRVSTSSASGWSVSEDGNVEAVRGAWVQVEAEANNPLTNAIVSVIDRGRTNSIRASVRGTHISFGMTLRSEGEWFMTLADSYGFTNIATPLYRLSLAADDPPYVEIREPRSDITVEVQKPVAVQYRAQDDHAVSAVTLVAELFDGTKRMTNRTLTLSVLSNGGKSAMGVTMLDYRVLRPNPGYSLLYHLIAVDSAGQTARSDVRRIIFPSMADLFLAMNKKRTEAESSLAALAEDASSLKKNAEAVEREAKRERALGTRGESDEKAQALSHDVKEMRKKLEDIAANVDKSVREAEVNRLLSPEVIGKLKEIRQSLNELNRETLAELDRNFSELMKAGGDRERTSAAAKMNAAEFEKRLDNLLAMLSELKDRERLSFLSREARDLASREKALHAELAAGMEYNAERMRREELIGERARALSGMIRENKAGLSAERAAMAKDALTRSGLSGTEKLGTQADAKEAKSRASAAGRSLDALASSLESMLADMMEDAASRVRTVIDNALISMHRINDRLARHKEWTDEASAAGRLTRIPAESRIIAKELAHYRGVMLRTKTEIVRELSRSVKGMDRLAALFDEVLSGFDDFSRAVDNRFDPSQLKRSLDMLTGRQYALTYRLIRLRDSADSQSSGQGEGMESMSERQRSVNERTRSMFGKGGMERDMSGMGDYLSELAEEQRLIQDAMRAMSGGGASEGKAGGEGGNEAGGKKFGGKEKGLGELSGMAEEMGKIEDEMKALAKKFDAKVYEEMLKRQSKLLERMLTYEKGLKRSNEEDTQYEAAGDTNTYSGSENDISAQTRLEQIKRIEEALKAKRYPEDHRKEIEGYVEYLRRTR